MLKLENMIIDGLSNFIDKVLTNLSALNIDVSDLELDHFAYQTSSEEDYKNKKFDAVQIGRLESENTVGGKHVSIYRLIQPYLYTRYNISGFEIVGPKVAELCDSCIDHVEFVLQTSFEDFINSYPQVNWNTTAMYRPDFPKLSLKFMDGTGVKFHLKNIFAEIPQQ